MSNLRIISFRITPEKVAELDQIAKTKDRDRSYLLNEAVETYLSEQRRNAVLSEKSLAPFPKGKPAGDADTAILIDYKKPGKTVATVSDFLTVGSSAPGISRLRKAHGKALTVATCYVLRKGK